MSRRSSAGIHKLEEREVSWENMENISQMIQNTLFSMATIEKIIRLANMILGWLKMGERQVTCGGLVLGSVKKIKPINENKSCHNPIQTNQNAVFVIAVLLVNS